MRDRAAGGERRATVVRDGGGFDDSGRFVDVWRYRDLVRAFARRDLAVRYRASAIGWGWSLIEPIVTLVFLSIVFLVIFRMQAPPMGNGRTGSYAAFLFCGLVGWHLFATMQTLAIDTLRSTGPLFAKAAFPGWAPVVGAQLVQVVQIVAEFAILVGFLLVLGNVGWTWLLAIPVLIGLALLSMGVSLVVGVASGYAGDVREIVVTVLGVLYFATPVLYPMEMARGTSRVLGLLVAANPLSWYLEGLHATLYSLVAPPWWFLGALVAVGVGALWAGLRVFSRLSRDLVDDL